MTWRRSIVDQINVGPDWQPHGNLQRRFPLDLAYPKLSLSTLRLLRLRRCERALRPVTADLYRLRNGGVGDIVAAFSGIVDSLFPGRSYLSGNG